MEDKKENIVPGSPEKGQAPEVTFSLLVSSLMMDGMVALGEVENPVTKSKEPDLNHAKFVIDMLALLQDKTKNNLTRDEEGMLDSILYELRMKFLEKKPI